MKKILLFLVLVFSLCVIWAEDVKTIWENNRQLPKIFDKDFYFLIRRLSIHETEKYENEPFIASSGIIARFYDKVSLPTELEQIKKYLNGRQEKIPFVVQLTFSASQVEALKSPESRKFMKDIDDRLMGFVHLEGKWNIIKPRYTKEWPHLLNLPFPENKESAYNLVQEYYNRQLKFENYPIASGSIGFLDHHTLRWGASATVTYFGGNLAYAQAQSAFARGAMRQFNKPWIVYYASWGNRAKNVPLASEKAPVGIDNAAQYNVIAPDVVYIGKDGACRSYLGPNCGPDPEVSMKMCYYYSYLAGANFIMHENDSNRLFYSSYDSREKYSDPLVYCLKDEKKYPSPVFHFYREFYAYTQRQTRANPYVPVAFLLDAHNGYIFPMRDTYFTFAPLLDGDYQIEAVLSDVFKYEGMYDNLTKAMASSSLKEIPAETVLFQNLAHGNFFDVITSDASQEIFKSYPVIMPLGLFADNPELRTKMINFVENGGLLITDAEHMLPEMPKGFYNVEFDKANKKPGTAIIFDDKKELKENLFTFYPATKFSAIPVCKDAETKQPLVFLNKFGKGRVIISGIPYFCNNAENLARKPLKAFGAILNGILNEYLPFELTIKKGSLDWSINKTAGGWLVTMMNFDGIVHNYCQKTFFDLSKTANATLSISGKWSVLETITEKQLTTDYRDNITRLDFQLKPGEIKIIEFNQQGERKL